MTYAPDDSDVGVSLHLIPKRVHRLWGRGQLWHDGPIRTFGVGSLLLATWRM